MRRTEITCDLCKKTPVEPVLVLEITAAAHNHSRDLDRRLDVCSACADTLSRWLHSEQPILVLKAAVQRST
jgi:hypothetical protein